MPSQLSPGRQSGIADPVPLVTDGLPQKKENRLVLKNEVANAEFMVGGAAY
jgi:hypothetical protein